jgi:hypothetical protein
MMITDTSHSAAEDFDRARRRAFWRHIAARLARRDDALLPFDEVRTRLRAQAQHDGGLRQVPIAQIVGSVGRYRDFDRAFLPRRNTTRGRWLSIDRAYYEDLALPPIEVYQLGETYFVKDGNHRVSVAREQGQLFIDARVIELHAPVPITSLRELEDWVCRQDAVDFMARTRLLELRPAARVELSLPGQYPKLLEHIEVHRWFLGVEQDGPVSWEQAVASWYDRVYSDLVEVLRSTGVLADFPGRTEADLYVWLIEHCWYLQQAGELAESAPRGDVVRAYAKAFSPRPRRRLARLARSVSRRLHAA